MYEIKTLNNLYVGMQLGTCINCGDAVVLRQPWLSKKMTVYDGWYLVHCSNEECHNHYGMELRLHELYMTDFINWSCDRMKLVEQKTVKFTIIKGGKHI